MNSITLFLFFCFLYLYINNYYLFLMYHIRLSECRINKVNKDASVSSIVATLFTSHPSRASRPGTKVVAALEPLATSRTFEDTVVFTLCFPATAPYNLYICSQAVVFIDCVR